MDKEKYAAPGNTYTRATVSGPADPEKERQFFKEMERVIYQHYENGGNPAAIEQTLRFFADHRDKWDSLKWREEVKELAERTKPLPSRSLDWSSRSGKTIRRLPPRDKDRDRDR